MTAPQPSQDGQQEPDEEGAIAALAVLLASGLTVAAMIPYAVALLAPFGIEAAAVAAVVRLATSDPTLAVSSTTSTTTPVWDVYQGRITVRTSVTKRSGTVTPIRRTGPATTNVRAQEAGMRARYLLAAARRVHQDVRDGTKLRDAISSERRYYDAHKRASDNRVAAAQEVDRAAAIHGNLLGWNTVIDSHTDAACIAANGKNFHATMRPAIGWPGSVHPHCRCTPGKPFPGGRVLP